jgi:hypothetical protein
MQNVECLLKSFAAFATERADACSAQTTPADRVKAIEAIYPPWQHGDDSDVTDRAFEFTLPPANVLADFHGSLDNPHGPSSGVIDSLDEAKAAFRRAWERPLSKSRRDMLNLNLSGHDPSLP